MVAGPLVIALSTRRLTGTGMVAVSVSPAGIEKLLPSSVTKRPVEPPTKVLMSRSEESVDTTVIMTGGGAIVTVTNVVADERTAAVFVGAAEVAASVEIAESCKSMTLLTVVMVGSIRQVSVVEPRLQHRVPVEIVV